MWKLLFVVSLSVVCSAKDLRVENTDIEVPEVKSIAMSQPFDLESIEAILPQISSMVSNLPKINIPSVQVPAVSSVNRPIANVPYTYGPAVNSPGIPNEKFPFVSNSIPAGSPHIDATSFSSTNIDLVTATIEKLFEDVQRYVSSVQGELEQLKFDTSTFNIGEMAQGNPAGINRIVRNAGQFLKKTMDALQPYA